MANALFVSYPGEPVNPTTFLPDNGLASLAATLLREGHAAYVLDYGTVDLFRDCIPDYVKCDLAELFSRKKVQATTVADNERILEIDKELVRHRDSVIEMIGREIVGTIADRDISFIGFKSWLGDAHPALVRLSEIVKQNYPTLPVLVGGPQVLSFGDIMLEQGSFDFLCYDEGELTVRSFARHVEGKERIDNVPNIMYRSGGKVVRNRHEVVANLDELAMPVYDSSIYPAMMDNQKCKMIVIDESRRCMYSCPFCIESSKVKGKWRAKSAERIVNEIQYVHDYYGANLIRFGGQMTTGTLMEDISRKILDENIDVEFTSFSHIGTMKTADFELMRRAGLYSLFFGVESGSQRMLSGALGKKTKVEDIETVLKRASDAGIYVVASIIYPSPGDNDETMQETVDLLTRAGVKSAPVQFAGVYPGTTWARSYKEYGFDLDPETYARNVIDYKIKNIFPPQFWSPLPVKIDGKSFFEYIGDTGKMIYALESRGILSDVTDEQSLLAKRAGMTPREFRDESQRIFYTGNANRMQEIVEKVNIQ